MVEKMKKIDLFIYHSSKDRFLKDLQEYGAVHIEADQSVESDEVFALKEQITHFQKISSELKGIRKENGNQVPQEDFPRPIMRISDEIDEINNKTADISSKIEVISKEIDVLEIWGEFDPSKFEDLKQQGIRTRFFSCAESVYEGIEFPEEAYPAVVHKEHNHVYFVLFDKGQISASEIPAVEERVPMKSLKQTMLEKEQLEKEVLAENSRINEYLKYIDWIDSEILKLKDQLAYETTGSSLIPEVEGKVLLMKAWIPAVNLKNVTAFLDQKDAAYLVSDPETDDQIPVKLRNNRFSKLFEPIIELFSLPSYTEIDPTFLIAPFFTLFFGMCLADVGYGLIVLIISTVMMFKLKQQNLKNMMKLGMIFGAVTMLGGVLFDTFFGSGNVSALFPGSAHGLILFGTQDDAMSFALVLGVIQVIAGYLMQTVNKIRENGIQGGFQPAGTIMIVVGVLLYALMQLDPGFSSGPLEIGQWVRAVPSAETLGIGMAAVGLVLVLLFNNLSMKIYLRPLAGLWELYGIVTGVPGDILSYIRLFALGLAGGLLGQSVNTIAMMVRGDSPVGFFFMALIMLIGHSMNMILAMLGAFVHPLRLKFVEFYKSVDFKGGGIAFSPFRYQSKSS